MKDGKRSKTAFMLHFFLHGFSRLCYSFFSCYVFADKMPVEKRDSIISEKKISPNGQGLYFLFQPPNRSPANIRITRGRTIFSSLEGWRRQSGLKIFTFFIPLQINNKKTKTFHILARNHFTSRSLSPPPPSLSFSPKKKETKFYPISLKFKFA